MKQAIILAAGEGQRLRPFTGETPKVMLSVGGQPLLKHVIRALAKAGIRDVVIVVGYNREKVFDGLADGSEMGVNISYTVQECQAGTAHALRQAESLAAEKFLLLPGDQLINAETISSITTIEPQALLTCMVPEKQTVRYGVVNQENGMVNTIIEKPKEQCCAPVSTGIFALSRAVFDYIQDDTDMPAVINRMIGAGIDFKTIQSQGPWLDIVYPWDILNLNEHLLQSVNLNIGGTVETGCFIKGAVSIGNGSVVRSGTYIHGPVKMGENCIIGPFAVIGPGVTLGDNVIIKPFSVIENCVIGSDVSIGTGALIQDTVIDSGCRIDSGFNASAGDAEVFLAGEFFQLKTGVMMGGNCRISSNVTAMPGSIIGNQCRVEAQKMIRGTIPDCGLVM